MKPRVKQLWEKNYYDLKELVVRWKPHSYLRRGDADWVFQAIALGGYEFEWSFLKKKWTTIPGKEKIVEVIKEVPVEKIVYKEKESGDGIDWKKAYDELNKKFQERMEKQDKIIETKEKEMEVRKKEDIRILMKDKTEALMKVSNERDRYLKRAEYLEKKYEPNGELP